MKNPPRSDNGQLAILLAGTRERLADAHLVHALDFIQRTSSDIEAPRALQVYSRLHFLDEHDERHLKNRVLASFSHVTDAGNGKGHTFTAVGGDIEWDVTASLFYRLRRRLGGRRNPRLRRWVELHTGYVEARLLRVHADNVERLLEVTGTTDGAVADTIRVYMHELRLRESLFEAIDIAVCERLYPVVTQGTKVTLRVQRGGASGG